MVQNALLLGVAALLLNGCTGGADTGAPASGTIPAPAPNAAIPENLRATAAAFAKYRNLDACGLHDIAAAEKASGDSKGDEIMPGSGGFGSCVLRLGKGEFNATWTLYVEVADKFDSARRREAAQEEVGGVKVFSKEEADPSCLLAMPLDETFAVTLKVVPADRKNAPEPPCQFAKEYLGEIAAIWKSPPQRGSGRTAPDFPLALKDPCDAASVLAHDLGQGTEVRPGELYECTLKPGAPPSDPKQKVSRDIVVRYLLDEDPSLLLSGALASQHKGLDVSGRKLVMRQNKGGDCKSSIAWDPDTRVVEDARSEDARASMQVIEIETPTCDQAQAAVQKILAKVDQR